MTHSSRAQDARVGTYVSSASGFRTSSYWLEGPAGLVLIDTQFLPSAALEAVEWAEAATGKRVRLAVVLHANPDKFNGTAALQARGIEVVTSEQVLALIPAVHELRKGWFYERYRPDYPSDAARPTSFGAATRTLSAAGLSLQLHVLGAGCSAAHVALEWEGHLFVGDLVTNGCHAWLELGRLREWQARLDELAALEPRWVHPGRGPSGGAQLIVRQRAYLTRVAELAGEIAAKSSGAPREAEQEQLSAAVLAAYPGLDFERFVELGAEEVLRAARAGD